MYLASNRGLVNKTHDQEVVGSNPAVYWMDVINIEITLKRKRIKVAKWGTPKKYLKKISSTEHI